MRKTVSPTNTTAEAQDNPLGILATAMVFGSSNALERMEAQGQKELTNSDVLPTKGLNDPAFAKMGIVIGEQVPKDPLFTVVTLPAGWLKRPTDHSMWSELVDDKGRVRATFFYKAAFYDRDAHISPKRRFSAAPQVVYDKPQTVRAVVTDCDKPIFEGESMPYAAGNGNYELAREQAESWLQERYPDHKDASAYWD